MGAVTRYLEDLHLSDMALGTVRSYAYGLLRWFRVLWMVGTPWETATRSDVEVLVGWLRAAPNPQRRRGAASGSVPGAVNLKTGKRNLGSGYAPSGINHTLCVVSSFYDFHLQYGRGPLMNPVPMNPARAAALRHRSPLQHPAVYRRGSLRQRVPRGEPRAVPDHLWDELFEAMRCDRDRALLLMFVSSGARAEELLKVTLGDLDWAGLRFYVTSKGTRARQAIPASQEAFRVLARYLDEQPPCRPSDTIWRTRRGSQRALTYSAMRRILQRANATLGTNWTAHDLRHTASMRMVNDPDISLVEAQTVLRHASVETTGTYQRIRVEDMFDKLQEHYAKPRVETRLAEGYSADDMKVVFGG